jgi:hypothetical protein
MLLAIERREQRPLGGAEVSLDIDHIHPDIPFSEGTIFKAGVGRVLDLENKKGDELGKQLARRLCQFCAALSQLELAFEVPPQTEGDQNVMQHLERWELVFIYDLVIAEHVVRAVSRPVKVLNRPMDEDTLERLCLGQTDGPVFLHVLQRQLRGPQHWRMREIGMVIGKGTEFDHVGMLPQSNPRCQNQKGPRCFQGIRPV